MRSDDQIVFDEARQLIRDGDFAGALIPLEALIAVHPRSAALRWHRSRCLRALDRDAEAAADLDTVLALKPDYVPALVARAELAEADDAGDQAIDLLRRARAIDAGDADVAFRLALLLADHGGGDEAIALLSRAIVADPSRHEAWRLRADLRHHLASSPADDADVVSDPLGMRYDRAQLESALADYQAAVAIADDLRVDLRIADIAQRLGRYEEAVVHCDAVLARLSADDPVRPHVQELRDRAAAGPDGEREHYARMIEAALGEAAGADRSLQDDVAHAALRGAADQIRRGGDVASALDDFVPESPEDASANYIAHQIHNLAHEPPPGLEAAVAGEFPRYQQRHLAAVRSAIEPLGYVHLTDAEAKNLGQTLGQRVLIGLYLHPQYGTAAAYAMRPKWPGLLGFLALLVTGRWRAQRMLECVSRFADGTFLSTREAGADVFEYGAAESFHLEKLADGSGPRAVAERHAARVRERLADLPGAAVDVPTTLDAIEGQWIESNQLKAEYRRSIDYVTDTELRSLLGKHYDRYAEKVRARLALMTTE